MLCSKILLHILYELDLTLTWREYALMYLVFVSKTLFSYNSFLGFSIEFSSLVVYYVHPWLDVGQILDKHSWSGYVFLWFDNMLNQVEP